MIIGSCGYGGTGSSVLTDLLREYEDVQVFDEFEFLLAYKVDGLQDLEYHLMKQFSKTSSGDYAIKRFLDSSRIYLTPFIHKPCKGKVFYSLSKEYISNIEQMNYKGIESVDLNRGNIFANMNAFFWKKIGMKFFEKIFNRRLFWWPARTIHFSIMPENFYEQTKIYVNNVLKAMGADLSKPICLDQPFEGNAPEQSMKFYDDPYAILIDRDPRDLYLGYKYSKNVDGKFYPHSTVQDFIVYYKKLRPPVAQTNRILKIRFEEFVYEYDNTCKNIEKFLNLSNHIHPKKWFDPKKSINNTQLIRKHPEDIEAIKLIEQELPEYLFPFEKYPNVVFNGQSFSGAGRKMTKQ